MNGEKPSVSDAIKTCLSIELSSSQVFGCARHPAQRRNLPAGPFWWQSAISVGRRKAGREGCKFCAATSAPSMGSGTPAAGW